MATALFRKLLLDTIREALAPLGFRKRDAYFRRDVADMVHVVQVQSSTKSTADTLIATVNVGVFSRELERRLRGPIVDPKVEECHWRQRLGHLGPANRDVWWEVRSEAEAVATAVEIVGLIREFALPALDHLSSTAKLRALWESDGAPGLTDQTRRRYLEALTQPTT